MVDDVNRSWWLFVLRGVCAVLFGVLAFLWPGIALASLVLLFGAYAFMNGVFALVVAIRAPKGMPGRGFTAALGVLGMATGIVTAFFPGITALSLLAVIAAWAILTGAFEIAAGVKLRHLMRGTWMLVVTGLLSIVFGGLVVAMPGAGALSIVWLIGAYAIAFGILLFVVAAQLKRAQSLIGAPAGAA